VNAVEAVFGRLESMGRDARSFHGARVATIGPSTAASLKSRGIVADLVATESVSESLFDALRGAGVAGKRVLSPGAETRRDVLTTGLVALGATVREVSAYRTVPAEASRQRIAELVDQGIDVTTFTSSSSVRNLVALLGGDIAALKGVKVACIGRISAATAREAGLGVDILAKESTAKGLVDALKLYYDQEGGSR
jgi:uroporphyrinogen-III synthase